MPTQTALIGASGFIGLRCTELLHGRDDMEIIPVVRSFSSLAVVARQRLAWRIADPCKPADLTKALQGCTVCIHAAIGDAAQIVRMADVAYESCTKAGVRRLVWLSSASVHGQDCPQGTTEDSPLHTRHPLVYNNAKVRAEQRLLSLAKNGRVELVMLRPGVVFGPRSRWITDSIDQLIEARAAWINRGEGICNSIYVDNLVEAVRLAATHPKAAGRTYLVGDEETIRWRDFLIPIAAELGLGEQAFHPITETRVKAEKESRLAAFTLTPVYGRLTGLCPDIAKRLVKGVLRALPARAEPPNAWTLRPHVTPRLNSEHTLLQLCSWKLPHDRIRDELGYRAPVSFAEGLRRSLSWARTFAYPHLPHH